MVFVKDLGWAHKLTPDFREALEQFLPNWLQSLIPYYKEGKTVGADVFELSNYTIITLEDGDKLYDKDGVYYYLHNAPGDIVKLAFNGDKGYRKCNWLECFCKFLPGYDTASQENIENFIYYDLPMTRCFNHRPEYRELADRCDAYFKEITGDSEAGLSLSGTSMIYYNGRGRCYIDYWCGRY